MSKIKLLADRGATALASTNYQYWQKYFDIEPYQDDQRYAPGSAVLIGYTESIDHLLHKGYRPIVDHLFDSAQYQTSVLEPNKMTLHAPDWQWINEFRVIRGLGYQSLSWRDQDSPTKFFLLPMNLKRDIRDTLKNHVQPYLNDSVWSYAQEGRFLPDDEFVPGTNKATPVNDRAYRPQWYADTCFSLVSESALNTNRMGFGMKPDQVHCSEKTFKPLAYRHPFVIYGTWHSLQYLRSHGFETFGEFFEESYDEEMDTWLRFQKILKVLAALYQQYKNNGSVLQNSRVKEITKHNYYRFWDEPYVTQLFEKQIVWPIINFVET